MSIFVNIPARLINKATKEASYLCSFKTYVDDFEGKKGSLDAKRRTVLTAVEEAKKRNETLVYAKVQIWLEQADYYISQEDPMPTKTCLFGWCPNCYWKYRRGKIVAKRTGDIIHLIESCNFDRVAHAYFSTRYFINFESRKSESDKLVNALEDENCSMIGLYGMAGIGKTTLANEVGRRVGNSGAFEKVILVVVSSPPDIREIQLQIARSLNLELEEGREEVYWRVLWSRIDNIKKRVLIILDDVWEELNLKDIGIPSGPSHSNCCVLITTCYSGVCKAMGCQRTIGLQSLTDLEALNLFVESVGKRRDDDSFMDLAQEIVHELEGLTIVVVSIGRALRLEPQTIWKTYLKILQRSDSLDVVDKSMTWFYKYLKLSYDRLEKSSKHVFLLCSLFPKGYEIPIDLLCKLSIGLGLFDEQAYSYLAARSKAMGAKHILISSSLLLEAKELYVKMHRVVREMALWVSDEDLQVIMDSRAPVKSHIRFLFWSENEFPNQFDATRLEILVLWVKGKAEAEDSCTIFQGMAGLRVLFLRCDSDHKYVTLSLKLLHSLMNIRTLILDGWKLDDISGLKILSGLEIIELTNCIINELPDELRELKNLRSLGLRKCKIERNNPFVVIERCIQLEELDFVLNSNVEDWKEESERENIDEAVPEVSPPTLKRYSIACHYLKYFDHDDIGMLNCFNGEKLKNLISNAMFKNIVRTAGVLELGEISDADGRVLSLTSFLSKMEA